MNKEKNHLTEDYGHVHKAEIDALPIGEQRRNAARSFLQRRLNP